MRPVVAAEAGRRRTRNRYRCGWSCSIVCRRRILSAGVRVIAEDDVDPAIQLVHHVAAAAVDVEVGQCDRHGGAAGAGERRGLVAHRGDGTGRVNLGMKQPPARVAAIEDPVPVGPHPIAVRRPRPLRKRRVRAVTALLVGTNPLSHSTASESTTPSLSSSLETTLSRSSCPGSSRILKSASWESWVAGVSGPATCTSHALPVADRSFWLESIQCHPSSGNPNGVHSNSSRSMPMRSSPQIATPPG